MKTKTSILLCFLTLFIVILLDQGSKALIVKLCSPYEIYKSFFGDLLNITLVYNTGAAFSFGYNFTGALRFITLLALPLAGIIGLGIFSLLSKEITNMQRLFIFGIIGGGLGNLLDRFFRSEGVVDFIDVKFFGIFGMERWPTFNIADMAVIIFGVLLLISFIFIERKNKKIANEENNTDTI
ncbi:MAG: signal peptidase II [Spirochaetaceae bacterium]|nr:signal peptidase II [Spirochaetaceae bacterium]